MYTAVWLSNEFHDLSVTPIDSLWRVLIFISWHSQILLVVLVALKRIHTTAFNETLF